MPHPPVLAKLLRLPGFYAEGGSFNTYFTEDRAAELLTNILGDMNSFFDVNDMKETFVKTIKELFHGANQMSVVYLTLRGHSAFYETLAGAWDDCIAGEVSGEDVKTLMRFFVAARRGFSPPSGNQVQWELTDQVDSWITILAQGHNLGPLQQSTVTMHNAPATVPDLVAGLADTAFALGAPNYDWPPGHFTPQDRALVLDPNVKIILSGVSSFDKQPGKRPALPSASSTPLDAKLWLSYLALAHNTPDKSWALSLLPIGPFKGNKDRAAWKPATGKLSRVCGTWDGLVNKTTDAFDAGKSSVICLLTPWRGTPNQLVQLGKSRNEQQMIWANQCPRQGLVLVLHKVTVQGQHGFEYVLYDPTLHCPRIRGQSWVNASLNHLFQFRQSLQEQVNQLVGGRILRGWAGGRHTSLAGTPDSVQMSSQLISDIVSAPVPNPFDMSEEQWRRLGFSPMQGYQY